MTDWEQLEKDKAASTPGPWEWWTSCSWRRLSARGDGDVICPTVSRSDGHPDIIIDGPNARLIAATPDLAALALAGRELAEAAQNAYERCEEWSNDNLTDENARDWMGHVDPALALLIGALAAFRKAEGESHE